MWALCAPVTRAEPTSMCAPEAKGREDHHTGPGLGASLAHDAPQRYGYLG